MTSRAIQYLECIYFHFYFRASLVEKITSAIHAVQLITDNAVELIQSKTDY